MRQYFGAVRRDQHGIFQPDGQLTRDVCARLQHDHHARFQHLIVVGHDARRFVAGRTDRVACMVSIYRIARPRE